MEGVAKSNIGVPLILTATVYQIAAVVLSNKLSNSLFPLKMEILLKNNRIQMFSYLKNYRFAVFDLLGKGVALRMLSFAFFFGFHHILIEEEDKKRQRNELPISSIHLYPLAYLLPYFNIYSHIIFTYLFSFLKN